MSNISRRGLLSSISLLLFPTLALSQPKEKELEIKWEKFKAFKEWVIYKTEFYHKGRKMYGVVEFYTNGDTMLFVSSDIREDEIDETIMITKKGLKNKNLDEITKELIKIVKICV